MISKGVVVNHRFTVHSLLGEGGFGHVYLAFDRDIGRTCALKMLRPELSSNAQLQDSFTNEARIWLNLGKHPNVVSALAVDLFNGRLFISLEFIPPDERGVNTLGQAMSKRSIALPLALKWAIEITSGLLHGYNHGLIAHRDLKPSNIMVDASDHAQITDFGLANYHIAPTRSRVDASISGTPLYMAPEQFIDGACCNQRSDIYSFGIILYQMLHGGGLPFDLPDPDPQAYFAVLRYVHNSYQLARFGSPFYEVIRMCLEKNPDNRYQRAEDLLRDLERIHCEVLGHKYIPPSKAETTARDLNNHAVSFFKLGDLPHALSLIDKALILDPHLYLAINNKASFLANSGRISDAVSLWTALTRSAPNLGRSFYNLGNVMMGQGRLEAAIVRFRECISVEPDYVPALANLAICYQQSGDNDAASMMYDEAIRVSPNDAQLHYNKGVLLFENGQFADALPHLTFAASLNPNHVSTLNYLGLCYRGIGEHRKAIASFDEALSINPAYEHAVRNRAAAVASLRLDGGL